MDREQETSPEVAVDLWWQSASVLGSKPVLGRVCSMWLPIFCLCQTDGPQGLSLLAFQILGRTPGVTALVLLWTYHNPQAPQVHEIPEQKNIQVDLFSPRGIFPTRGSG